MYFLRFTIINYFFISVLYSLSNSTVVDFHIAYCNILHVSPLHEATTQTPANADLNAH